MVDNVITNVTSSTGATFATDQVGTVHVPFTKLDVGGWNATAPMTASTPLFAQLTAGTAAIGKLGAGTAEIGKLAEGSAAIGKLAANDGVDIGNVDIASIAANDGVDIGDVDVTSVAPGYAATSLGKREDDAHASLDVGVMALGVRKDTAAGLAADGDYHPLEVNSTGELRTVIGNSVTLAAADGVDIGNVDVTSVIPGVAATNLGKAVDSALEATDTGVAALAVRDDALTTLTPVDGDYTNLRVSSVGALHVTGGGGGTEYTEDVASADPIVGSATVMERDDTIGALTPIEGDWAAMRCSAEGALWVQEFNSDDSLTALQIIDNPVFVDDAAFALTTSSVMVSGGIRDDSLGALAAVEGDAVPFRVSSTGALHVTGGGGGTEYTEDVATADPIVGTATVMERDDALSSLTPIEGDWAALRCSAEGALWTQDFNSDNALTALQLIDNPVLVDDGAFTLTTSSVMMAGAIRDDSLTTLAAVEGDAVPLRVGSTGALHVTGGGGGTEYTEDVATADPIVGTATMMERDDVIASLTPIEGDWAALRCSAEGALWTQDFNSDAILADLTTIAAAVDTEMQVDIVASATITVDGTVTADLGATDNAVLDAIAASVAGTLTVNGSGVTQPVSGTVTADLGATDNAVLDAIAAAQLVDGHAVTVDNGAGTDAVISQGQQAHGATTVAGSPVRIGAHTTTTDITAVTTDDTTDLVADINGKLVTMPYAVPERLWDGITGAMTGTSDVSIVATAGGGLRNYMTTLLCTNSHATVGTVVQIKDGSTNVFEGYAAPAGGGFSVTFNSPLRGTANTAWNADNQTTGSNTYVSASGFIAP